MILYNNMILTFTGHRPAKLGCGYDIPNPTYDHIRSETEKLLKKLKPEKAISGMAIGYDQWAAQICVDLNIPWIAAVPFADQDVIWPKESRAVYNRLIKKATEVVIVSEGVYAGWKMQKRNEWMVDHADIVIGLFDGSPGGTANCLRYAQEQNKMIYRISPILPVTQSE